MANELIQSSRLYSTDTIIIIYNNAYAAHVRNYGISTQLKSAVALKNSVVPCCVQKRTDSVCMYVRR